MKKGKVIILSGPSGVGKDTVINAWQKINPLIYKVVTCTTRAIREEEQNEIDYLFMTSDEFKENIKKDYFIEYSQVYDHYYGISKNSIVDALEKGSWVVLKIDVQGAFKMLKIFPDALTLFLAPPSIKELEFRIIKRGKDSPQAIQKRLQKAQLEIEQSKSYDHVIVNDTLSKAIAQLEKIFRDSVNLRI